MTRGFSALAQIIALAAQGAQGRRCAASERMLVVGPSILAVFCVATYSAVAVAAEIRLRSEAVPAGPMVTLGDLADIVGNDVQQTSRLRAIELFPAPAPGVQRYIRLREIQDLLLLRGENLVEHQFSGAVQVAVAAAAKPDDESGLAPADHRRAVSRVKEVLDRFLRERLSDDAAWKIEVQLSSKVARRLIEHRGSINVRGGAAPWTGRQQFELILGSEPAESVSVEAEVRLCPRVVIAVRPLARGAIITVDDVELRAAGDDIAGDAFRSLDEVIGREVQRSISPGRPIVRDALRSPIAVRRGDVVTVYARSPGISVRTTARAKDEGAVNDLIAVESFQTRKVFLARVCGIREVEVFAQAPRVEGVAPVDDGGLGGRLSQSPAAMR